MKLLLVRSGGVVSVSKQKSGCALFIFLRTFRTSVSRSLPSLESPTSFRCKPSLRNRWFLSTNCSQKFEKLTFSILHNSSSLALVNMALLRKRISIVFLGKISIHKTFLLLSFNVRISVLYLCKSSSGFVSVSYSSSVPHMVHIKSLSSFTSMFLTTFSISEIEAPVILIIFLFRGFRRTNSLFIFLIIDVMVSFSDSSTSSTENGFETGIWKLADGFGLVPFLTREKSFGSWGLSAPLPNETFLVRVGLVLLLSRWKLVGFSDFLSLFPGLRLLMKELSISSFTISFETSFVELSLMFFSGWLTGGDATAFTFPDDMLTFLILFISCLRTSTSCLRSFISCLRSFIWLKSSAVFTFPDDLSVFLELLILFVRYSIFVVKKQK